jgi:hypothetical protein
MKNTISRTRFLVLMLLCSLFFGFESSARKIYITKGSDGGRTIDGRTFAHSPGDTLALSITQSPYSYITLDYFNGSPSQPLVVINEGGQVTLTQGFKFSSCTNIKLTGSGSGDQYGFKIESFPWFGVAIEITDRSANFEVERMFINSKNYGFWIKKEGTCDPSMQHPAWRLDNISIHDNKITNMEQEAMYIGSTGPNGERPVVCNGVTTYPKPMRLSNLKIYNNIVDHTRRGGIQVSLADEGHNEIYNNTISNVGYEYDPAQGNGIVLGGYTQAYVHDNTVINTFSTGIFSLGAGEVRIENNRVENSGNLEGVVAYGMANIMVDTRLTDPVKKTTFIIRNNKVAGNTDWNIRIYNQFPTYNNGNYICNNTTPSGGPVTVSVPLGIDYTNCSPNNQLPVPKAGPDQVMNLPNNTAQLAGSATDPDGLITTYTWTKVSGPAQFSISNANSTTPLLTNLVEGVYIFRLTVTDNSGALAQDDMTISVNIPPPASYKPVPVKIEAEAWDLMLGVQTENTTDAGGGLAVGYIDNDDWLEYNINVPTAGNYALQFRVATVNSGAKFNFFKHDGTGTTVNVPQTGGFQNWQTVTSNISLPAGQQILRLTSKGNSWNFNWLQIGTVGDVTVNPTPSVTRIQAESWTNMQGVQTENTADAGGGLNVGYIDNGDWMDYSVTAPTAGNYKMSFRVATPGTGGQLQVKKLDGTVLATMGIPVTGAWQTWQTSSTTVALAAGTQIIRIQSSANGTWNYNWMEFAPANTPTNVSPVANAGPDATIQLPASTVQLNGTGTDADGTITRYNWTVVSGPSQYSISNASIANPVLSNLVAGTYTFRLSVTDNAEATISDDVIITVNAVASTSGIIKLEAENWSGMSGVQTENTSDEGGGQNVGYIDNNDWIDYSINISTAGTYNISFRVASPNSGSQLQLRRPDGSVLSTVNIPNTGSWQTWQTVTTTAALAQGQQTLRVYSLGNNWNINWIEFSPNTTPGPTTPVTQKIEAESWKAMFGVQTENTGDAGGGLNIGYVDYGDWMDYTVNPTASGTYTMNFRVASTYAGNQLQVKKADGTVIATVNFSNTGGWQSWQTTSAQVNLSAGEQVLRIVSSSSVNWNLNWFELVPGTAVVTPGASTVKIEAENWSGMNGVQTETTVDAGGGLNVGYIDINEWMNYNVNIAVAGTYTVSYRIATPNSGAQIQLKGADGTTLVTTNLVNTGAWQTWQTVTSMVNLPAGAQTLKLVSTGSNFNINWIEFSPAAISGTVSAKQVVSETEVVPSYTSVFPNNVHERFALKVSNDLKGVMAVEIVDENGSTVRKFSVNKSAAGTTQTYLSAAGLEAGTYTIQVKMDNWIQSSRILKQ